MSFSWAFQLYHFHLDPIWPDGTFKVILRLKKEEKMEHILDEVVPSDELKKFEQKFHEEMLSGQVTTHIKKFMFFLSEYYSH
jgi:hypothetical protein